MLKKISLILVINLGLLGTNALAASISFDCLSKGLNQCVRYEQPVAIRPEPQLKRFDQPVQERQRDCFSIIQSNDMSDHPKKLDDNYYDQFKCDNSHDISICQGVICKTSLDGERGKK